MTFKACEREERLVRMDELGGKARCVCPDCGVEHEPSAVGLAMFPRAFSFCPACAGKRDEAAKREADEEAKAKAAAKETERVRLALREWEKAAPAEFRALTLPDLLRGVGVSPAVAEAVAWEPTQDKPWLLLCGGSGSGKTSAVWLLLHKFAQRGLRAKVFSSGEFADAAVEAQMEGTASELRRELRSVDLLVLDDLDKEVLRERAQEMLFFALNARYAARLPIVITTNEDWAGLEKQWPDAETGAAAVRRMKQKSHVVACTGGRR